MSIIALFSVRPRRKKLDYEGLYVIMDIPATGGFIGNKAIVCGGYKYLATGFDKYMDDCYSITQNKIEFFTKITGYI